MRDATRADAPALAEFNRRIAHETENLSLIPEVIRRGVEAVFDDPARGFYVVAEARAELIASLMVTTEWSDWRNGAFWWIQSVYVIREWRRRGVYQSLYRHVRERAARDSGVCGFRLYVERDNRVAQQTYAAAGMRQTRYNLFEQLKPDVAFHLDQDK
ncbi:MAG: GNAT family N-acetyltransferase [bacterium]